MLRDRVAILFLEVARRSPWCRDTPAHVHWFLLRCPRGGGFSPLRSVSSRLSDGRRRHPSLPCRGSPLPSLCATNSPLRVHDCPTSGDSTTFPFVPAAPSGHRRRGRNSPTLSYSRSLLVCLASDTATTTVIFSSDSLPPPTTTRSHPSHRRAILSLRFTRDLSAFINYIATERCVSLLPALPDCLTAATSIVYSPGYGARFSPPRATRYGVRPRKSASVVYRHRPTENRRTPPLPFRAAATPVFSPRRSKDGYGTSNSRYDFFYVTT